MVLNTATIDNSNPVGHDVGTLFYIPIQFDIQYPLVGPITESR